MIVNLSSPTDRPARPRGPGSDPGPADRPTRSGPAGGEIVRSGVADRPTAPGRRRADRRGRGPPTDRPSGSHSTGRYIFTTPPEYFSGERYFPIACPHQRRCCVKLLAASTHHLSLAYLAAHAGGREDFASFASSLMNSLMAVAAVVLMHHHLQGIGAWDAPAHAHAHPTHNAPGVAVAACCRGRAGRRRTSAAPPKPKSAVMYLN